MGVIKRGVLGGFSGKVANVIGGSWKGIAYMRAMPLSVANPRTAGQVAQRGKLGLLVSIAKELLVPIIKPLNDRFASRMSGYNLFVMRNVEFASNASDLFQQMILSEGNLLDAVLENTRTTSTDIIVRWIDNSGTGNALSTDKAYGVLYNTDNGTLLVSSGVEDRSNGAMGFVYNGNPVGSGNWRLLVAFLSADGTRVSNTVRAGFSL